MVSNTPKAHYHLEREVAFKLDDLLSMVSQALMLPHHVVSQASEEDKKSVKRKD